MYSERRPGDNTPIGLDDDYQPFLVTKPVTDEAAPDDNQ